MPVKLCPIVGLASQKDMEKLDWVHDDNSPGKQTDEEEWLNYLGMFIFHTGEIK